ncbi:MAG: TetR/AcrR family transcriptional regulator [Candidatus Dormibacteria bacterium]
MSAIRVEEVPHRALPALGAPPSFEGVDENALLPPRIAAAGTRRRILCSALRLFAEKGYHAVPVRAIATGAGIRASSMYEHHAAKEEILRDLLLIGHEAHRDWLHAARQSAGSDPVAQLSALVHAHVRFHATYPLLARVCNRELGALSPERLDEVLAVRSNALQELTAPIEIGVRDGVFDVPDTYLAGAAIGALGLRVPEWYRPDSGISVDELADTYSLFALRLLGADPDAPTPARRARPRVT